MYCHRVPDKTVKLTTEGRLEDAAQELLQVDFLQEVGARGLSPDGRYPELRLTDRGGGTHHLAALVLDRGPSVLRRTRTPAAQSHRAEGVREADPAPAWLVEFRGRVAAYGSGHGGIVLAHYVDRSTGAVLRAAGVNYLDAGGNLYLALAGGRLVAHVEGRRPPARLRARVVGLRAAGYRVLFAILASPELLATTVREIERRSGASRQAASELLARLRGEGALVRSGRSEHRLAPGRRGELVARLAGGWVDALAPVLAIGSFRRRVGASVDADAAIERVFRRHRVDFGFGGTAGAMRLCPHYRGADTVLHVVDWNDELTRALDLVPDRSGPVRIYRTMGTLDLASKAEHCAHPLLVNAELVTSGDERAREAARFVREGYLHDSDA